MTPPSRKVPSQRHLRVGEEIRYALAVTLERGDVHDPTLASTPITVTDVRLSPDLKNATAFVTPLGGGDTSAVVAALKRATPFLRHKIAQKVALKYVPKLSFQPDTSFDAYRHINDLLHRPDVMRDILPSRPSSSRPHDSAAEQQGPAPDPAEHFRD